MYKYEIHLHSNNCSACAKSSFEEMLNAAALHGYSGVVFTNHFYGGNTCIDRSLNWKEFVGAYAESYHSAKTYGKKVGVDVFFGLEDGYGEGKEFLIYGITPKIIEKCPEFKNFDIQQKTEFIHKKGGITVCAHPFRHAPYIPNPNIEPDASLFDAIEGSNYFNTPDDNLKAVDFSKKNNLPYTAGGDLHNAVNFGNSGIMTENKIKSDKELIDVIRSGNFKCINSPENTIRK